MPKIKLTKTVVDGARPEAKDYEIRDAVTPGFLLKVTPSGRRIFMLAYIAANPKRPQSATSVDVDGQISRRGDGEVRTALHEAASAMMTRSRQRSALKAWGTQLAAKRGHKRAVVAVARKLAVVRHRMWIDGATFGISAADRHGERRIGTAAAVAHAA
jgi:hypothetical protein